MSCSSHFSAFRDGALTSPSAASDEFDCPIAAPTRPRCAGRVPR